MSKYMVRCAVDGGKLGTVLALFDEEPDVQLLGVELIPDVPPQARTLPNFRYANGIKNKGISGHDLLRRLLAERSTPVKLSELRDDFEKNGFSRHTVSATMSQLIALGDAERLGKALYQLKRPPA